MFFFRTQLENCQLVHMDHEPEGNPLIQPAIVESLSSSNVAAKKEKYNAEIAFIFFLWVFFFFFFGNSVMVSVLLSK